MFSSGKHIELQNEIFRMKYVCENVKNLPSNDCWHVLQNIEIDDVSRLDFNEWLFLVLGTRLCRIELLKKNYFLFDIFLFTGIQSFW